MAWVSNITGRRGLVSAADVSAPPPTAITCTYGGLTATMTLTVNGS